MLAEDLEAAGNDFTRSGPERGVFASVDNRGEKQ